MFRMRKCYQYSIHQSIYVSYNMLKITINTGRVPSFRVFLRDPSPYLRKFQRKQWKSPNVWIDKRDRDLNPASPFNQFKGQNRSDTDGAIEENVRTAQSYVTGLLYKKSHLAIERRRIDRLSTSRKV